MYIVLFLHQTTTRSTLSRGARLLYIVLFLHQTTTEYCAIAFLLCCISYYSYIKPQQSFNGTNNINVVYRTIPTSNHNCLTVAEVFIGLYIVLFLHQTTTSYQPAHIRTLLYIVLFLHQTTTRDERDIAARRCISYYSYIKPQQRRS